MNSLEFPASILKLENGLTLIHQEIPSAVVAVDIWVKAGAIAEPIQWSGMAHFLEHMIFKGTDKVGPGWFDQVIESRGGMANAATSHDYAHYFLTTSPEHLAETLPCLAELLLNASIPADEFARERAVVIEEIHQAHDDPDWLAFQALTESIYQCHPYGRSVLGTEAILSARSPEEMRCFHDAYYQPENMTVVIVGGVTQASVLALVERTFKHFADRSECPVSEVAAEPPIVGIRRQEIQHPQLEQSRLLMAWIGPGVDHLQSAYGLDLLSVMLAEGRSSRLVRELREERQLVQAISSSFSLQRESGLFTISVWLEPEVINLVESIICERLNELTTTPISAAELRRCQRLLCNDYAFSTETSGQIAGLYGYYNTIAQAEISTIYPHRIQAFQAEELQGLVSQFLSPHNYAATILQPC
ncbi:MAG: insulinase family protein [Cyanothece sp. SIO1E1]|nr:insulinase family protein [Cyanothece sp. SIO1E1]